MMTWIWPTILAAIVIFLFRQLYELPELSAVTATRYLLMCAAMFLMSLYGLRCSETVEIGYLGLGASVVLLAGLVVVLVDAV